MMYNEVEKKVLEVIASLSDKRINQYEFYRKVGYSKEKCDTAIDNLKAKGKIDWKGIACSPIDPVGMFQFEFTLLIRIEYRIVGRFRKDDKSHVVDWDRKWTREDALHRLGELKEQSKREMEHKKRDTYFAGSIGIGTECYSEYDLLDLRIQSREVTPWSNIDNE